MECIHYTGGGIMLESLKVEKFKKQTTINSEHRVTAEWNFNDFIAIDDYGCYQSVPYNSDYSAGEGYDDGRSLSFFEGESLQFTVTASSGDTEITLGSGHGVTAGMRAEATSIPADTYVSAVSSTTVTLSKALIKSATDVEFSFYSYFIEDNKDRLKYSPMISVFESNRPDPGIVHLIGNTKNPNSIIDIEKLTVANFGDLTGDVRDDRVYPIYKNSKYRYWNSIRKIKLSNIPTTVGVANSAGAISYAAPFVVYSDSFYSNKISIKTQKYSGYPISFKVEVLYDEETDWTTVYTATDNTSLMSDGKLDIYFDGTTWGTTKSLVTQFIGEPSNTVHIYGIRFSVTRMSSGYVPLELIEISPRLEADITAYVMSFDKNTTFNNTSFGIPTAGVVSTTGSINVSNVDRIFSQRNPSSILSGLLYQGTKFSFYQVVEDEEIPLGTLYATEWNEQSDFTTSIGLEDYLFFLKSIKAPEIVIANISGVETSVAILMLLDNVGVTNYNFNRSSLDSTKDDFVMDYFYTNSDTSVAGVLEQIAKSAQYSIYVDANNIIQATTKEKITSIVDADNTNYWLVGSENWTEADDEYSYLDGEYVSNIVSISEETVDPITEATVSYTGNTIVKEAKSILRYNFGADPEEDANLLLNASLAARDLSYGVVSLWEISNSDGPQSSLIASTYISDVYGPEDYETDGIPQILYNAKSTPIQANNENDAIRYVYENSTDDEKAYFRIMLDPEFATLFLTNGKTSGYILIDSELIKYKGLVLDVFDDKDPNSSGRNIIFDDSEYAELRASVSSGSSILCRGILVDLNFEVQDIQNALVSGTKEYLFISSGRGQKNTDARFHYGATTTDFLNSKLVTKLYDDNYNKSLKPQGTMVAESVKLKDPTIYETEEDYRVAYPGYLKVSGPKSVGGKNSAANLNISGEPQLPIDNFGERFISGFYKKMPWTPHRISTRMRLLEKPKTQLVGSPETKNNFVNRGIGGIGFRLKQLPTGTTGYFLEIEEVGNITDNQLEDKKFNNLRLYKVTKNSSGKFIPKLLGSAFVNVSAVGYETVDSGETYINNGFSYTGTSDISITIEKTGKSFKYVVYWEAQKVLSVKESESDAINKKSNNIGLITRSDSEAMFEYMMAASNSMNGNYPVSTIFGKGSGFMNLEEANSRGLLPAGVSEMTVSGNKVKFFFEDFGRKVREVGKFSVSFNSPAVYAQLVSLKEVNPDYYVSDFSASSYGADFWVFNTSLSSINLGGDTNMPLIISGVGINKENDGTLTLSDYIKNKFGDDNERRGLFERNRAKYGTNNTAIVGEYLNSRIQAENLMQWIVDNATTSKNVVNADIFPNPLLELGDKVRIFYPEMQYNISNQKDKVYYVHSINYSVSGDGPKMSISVREI